MLPSLNFYLKSARKTVKTYLKHQLHTFKRVLENDICSSISKISGIKVSGTRSPRSSSSAAFASMKMSNQLEHVFKFIDANSDGKISPVELRKLLLCLGHARDKVEEEVEGMVKEMDANGDGFIDLSEYMNAVMNRRLVGKVEGPGGGDGRDTGFEDDEVVIRDAFLVFDYDNNGLISAKELHRVMSRLGFTDCNLKECNLMIKGVDKDGDGFVDFEDFRLMMTAVLS